MGVAKGGVYIMEALRDLGTSLALQKTDQNQEHGLATPC